MVGTQLYIIITQISTYNYMFRPCILAIVRLYINLISSYKCVRGVLWGDEISSYSSGWHVYKLSTCK